MKKCIAMCMLAALIGFGPLAHAADSECDCECKTGGLGLKISRFICGFGFKQYNTTLGCDKSVGIGLGIGGDLHRVQFGGGFDSGVFGLGFGFRGPEKTTFVGLSLGLDYSDCRMVWPIEE